MENQTDTSELIVTETEFEYIQWMLDYGASLIQALVEVRPDLHSQQQTLKECTIIVQ